MSESAHNLVRRHEQEKEDLNSEIKQLVKNAKKSEKAAAEARAVQMRFDLNAKHRQEIEELEEEKGETLEELLDKAPIQTTPKQEQDEEEKKNAKLNKLKKKQDKKNEKDKKKEQVKAEILASTSNVKSAREIENESIDRQLSTDLLCIKTIMSDGHCLYRAIADQIELIANNSPSTSSSGSINVIDRPDYRQLRNITASHIRSHREEFAPFLGLDSDDPEFDTYCNRIEDISGAEWGGQVEIKALCECLRRKILVYSADAPVLIMGEEFVHNRDHDMPIRISYHKHFYSLGEHYNSVVPLTIS